MTRIHDIAIEVMIGKVGAPIVRIGCSTVHVRGILQQSTWWQFIALLNIQQSTMANTFSASLDLYSP